MGKCRDCIHHDVCKDFIDTALNGLDYGKINFVADGCEFFKDRSRFVELPDVGDYDTVTTIDEAIDHCYQIVTSTDESVCAECKAEHMRLCG